MYVYEPSEEEKLAEAILKRNGWTVGRPQCPLCHGWGTVSDTKQWDYGNGITGTSWGNKSCPNGCPMPMVYL